MPITKSTFIPLIASLILIGCSTQQIKTDNQQQLDVKNKAEAVGYMYAVIERTKVSEFMCSKYQPSIKENLGKAISGWNARARNFILLTQAEFDISTNEQKNELKAAGVELTNCYIIWFDEMDYDQQLALCNKTIQFMNRDLEKQYPPNVIRHFDIYPLSIQPKIDNQEQLEVQNRTDAIGYMHTIIERNEVFNFECSKHQPSIKEDINNTLIDWRARARNLILLTQAEFDILTNERKNELKAARTYFNNQLSSWFHNMGKDLQLTACKKSINFMNRDLDKQYPFIKLFKI